MVDVLSRLLSERDWLMADGATGTTLFNMGLTAGDAPELWNVEHPDRIFQGRVGPYPLPLRLGSLVVITVWGGDRDKWDCGPPLGLCSDYRPTTQAASNYFSSQPNVVHIA